MRFRIYLLCLILAAALAACKKSETYNESTTATTSSTDTYASTTTDMTATVAAAPIPEKDKEFVINAGKGGKAEVEVATDALQHATNADVKAFAQKIVDDHTKANDKLAAIATSKDVTIPSEMQGEMKQVKERLLKLTGKSFDQAFVKQMVDDHTATIAKFEDESANGTDAEVKAFVDEALPTLRDHLKMAQDLWAKIGK